QEFAFHGVDGLVDVLASPLPGIGGHQLAVRNGGLKGTNFRIQSMDVLLATLVVGNLAVMAKAVQFAQTVAGGPGVETALDGVTDALAFGRGDGDFEVVGRDGLIGMVEEVVEVTGTEGVGDQNIRL